MSALPEPVLMGWMRGIRMGSDWLKEKRILKQMVMHSVKDSLILKLMDSYLEKNFPRAIQRGFLMEIPMVTETPTPK